MDRPNASVEPATSDDTVDATNQVLALACETARDMALTLGELLALADATVHRAEELTFLVLNPNCSAAETWMSSPAREVYEALYEYLTVVAATDRHLDHTIAELTALGLRERVLGRLEPGHAGVASKALERLDQRSQP